VVTLTSFCLVYMLPTLRVGSASVCLLMHVTYLHCSARLQHDHVSLLCCLCVDKGLVLLDSTWGSPSTAVVAAESLSMQLMLQLQARPHFQLILYRPNKGSKPNS
jgi:hypothetical protein